MEVFEIAEVSLFVTGMLLNVFIIPTVLNQNASLPRTQSIPTALGMVFGFGVPYLVLGMILPSVSSFLGGGLWAYVALFRNMNHDTSDTLSTEKTL